MLHPAFTSAATPGGADDGAPAAPQRRGRLAGWQIPVKDGTDVAGLPTTHGNPARTTHPTETDPFVEALLRAGATVPDKTLTSELGATCYAERPGVPVLESPAYPECTPGGSSTGAAVVVADGTCRAAHGTDAGGSVRVPAAACEVVGLKLAGRQLPAHGFLTRGVKDLFTLTGWPAGGRARRPVRIGVLTRGVFADPPVQDRRGAIVETLAALLPYDVVELAPYRESRETYAHFSVAIKAGFRNVDPLDSDYIGWLVEESHRLAPGALEAAAAHKRALPGLLAAQWGVDAVLSPTLAFDPPPLGYFPSLSPAESFEAQTQWSPWCSLFNVLGTPAIALGGVHLGSLTLTGPELLRVARDVEALLAGVAAG
ncbi:amidase family protein [Corynebacterium jeddahense]|uniref:amidase n=1 Tax=Corynebacterium jeddahense TaxID=1414719 RepID=A0ABY7UKA1_9CORY|nr:amidase [Corynebacterium jeddahense]WCZ39160.1 Enantioselective amidase [Corynebacterium jeddahense]